MGLTVRYQWGIRVPRGNTLRLGRLDLRRGSAVLGWVVTADGSTLGESGRVELRPRMGGPVRDQEAVSRLKALSFEAAIHPRGFFQLGGVPPGAYILEAKHERFAPATTTVRVVAGEVTEIANPPLALDVPKTLEVYLTPPLDPWGKPWAVRLLRLDRSSAVLTDVALEPAESGGSWKKMGLAPAQYLLKVGTQGGDTWRMEEVEVGPGLVPLHFDLDVLQVVGTVHLGKAPLAARLSFGGRWGATRIRAHSDEKGTFEVYLPKAGDWSVHVSSTAPSVSREIPKVKVQPKPESTVAEVALRLPNTRLAGRVIDGKGAAVTRAIVNAKSVGPVSEPQVQHFTDEQGKFELVGLPPGPLQVGAEGRGDRSADPVVVELADDRDSEPLLLTIRPQLRVSGTVASPDGVVTGAWIKAAPAGLSYFGVPTVTSDAQGHFEVSLPPATREMFLAVGPLRAAFELLDFGARAG